MKDEERAREKEKEKNFSYSAIRAKFYERNCTNNV